MPIYAYKCESCGFAKDVLQKMSDPVLTDCPSCGSAAFKKQLTAAGFQLKGTGWYATDFKGGAASASAPATGVEGAQKPASEVKPVESAPVSAPAVLPTPAASGS
jgi:putative FmdB family regulatory protein